MNHLAIYLTALFCFIDVGRCSYLEPTGLFTWFQEDSWYPEENVISGVWILSFYCLFDILACS